MKERDKDRLTGWMCRVCGKYFGSRKTARCHVRENHHGEWESPMGDRIDSPCTYRDESGYNKRGVR